MHGKGQIIWQDGRKYTGVRIYISLGIRGGQETW